MPMEGQTAYVLSAGKIRKVASGFDHAVRTGDNTFSIFFIDGSKVDLTIPIPKDGKDGEDGKEGISITDVSIETVSDKKHLFCILSDGRKIDAGEFSDSPVLSEDLKATVEIGTVTSGKLYPKNTKLEKIIRDMLIKEVAPSVTLTLTPSDLLYDIVSASVSSIKLSATITKGTYPVKTLKFYVGDNMVHEEEIGTGSGATTYNYTYAPSTPIKTDTTFKVVATDEKPLSGQATKTIKFVPHSYYGTVGSDIGTPTEAQIKALSKTLKDVKGHTYSDITMDFGKVVYAYPKSFGELTSIKDPVNNYNYTDTFSKTTVKVDGIDYLVYTQTDPSAAEGIKLVFA